MKFDNDWAWKKLDNFLLNCPEISQDEREVIIESINKEKTKKYLVSWNEDITCYAKVEADTKEEAEEIAKNMSYKNKDLEIDLINANGFDVKEVEE